MSPVFAQIRFLIKSCGITAAAITLFCALPAFADTSSAVTPLALQEALSANHPMNLYTPRQASGFNLSSSYFSGLASGVTAPDAVSDLNTDQRLYALLIDGRYDFNHESSGLSASALRPYVSAGFGVATAGTPGNSSAVSQGGNAVPLFRLGGGVAYRLDQRWNLSLNYQTGMAAPISGDQVFTGRGQQPVDLQALNLGMSFAF